MNSVKETFIKNCTYCLFNDMINMKYLDPNKIKIDKMSFKNILFYHIGYIMVKDLSSATINSANLLTLLAIK